MSVPIEQITPGAVFRFKAGLRRVKKLRDHAGTGFMVDYELVDGQPRRRQTGSQWVHYFRKEAIEQVPDPSAAGEQRQLLPSRRTVPCLDAPVDITLKTRCPAKWAMVDMETGELWGHDGQRFHRLTAMQSGEVAEIARMSAESA